MPARRRAPPGCGRKDVLFHHGDTEGTEISQSNQAATKNFTAETLGAQRKKMTNDK